MDKATTGGPPEQSLKLPPQQFAEILSAFRNSESCANAEKRRTTRMSVSAKLFLSTYDGKTLGRRFAVLARDFSMEGIGVLCGIEPKRGDLLVAHLPGTHARISHVICEAVFVGRMADGLFNIGCRFVRELPADQIPHA